MRRTLAALMLLPSVALGQSLPTPAYNGANIQVTPPGVPNTRTLPARAADDFNPRDFGAVGSGSAVTAQTALGITTLAQLAAYTRNGVTPYSWVSAYPYGNLFNLTPGAGQASGTTTLTFAATGTIGTQIPTNGTTASGATSMVLYDLTNTSDGAAVGVGTPLSGSCLAAGTTVTAMGGQFAGSHTVTLSAATTSSCASSTLITAQVQPASGKTSLPIVYTTGIRQGDLVTGSACIPAGTQVTQVERGRMEVYLSAALTCQPAAGAALTFIPSWLGQVTTGMAVTGPAGVFAANTTVSAVNTTTGVVTLSAATTGATASHDAYVGVTTPSILPTPVTFWSAYTDAQARGLEMDRLGIQAAIKAAEAAGGGTVRMPHGSYRIDGTITQTATTPYGLAMQTVSLVGDTESTNGVTLKVTKDLGPGNAALSCDDPTAKWQNARGIYTTTLNASPIGGLFCDGFWANFHLTMNGYSWAGYGIPPTVGGVPVAMDGMKQGPRRHLRNVWVDGFNHGALFMGDHTEMRNVKFYSNWIGWRHDKMSGAVPGSANSLFGDEVWDRFYSMQNSYAGISVDPGAYLNGSMISPYLAYNPWGIRCEAAPSSAAGQCLQGLVMMHPNIESTGCGVIVDAGKRDGYLATGGGRSINDVRIIAPFFGPTLANVAPGCKWNAYIDAYTVQGLVIDDIFAGTFPNVANATALIRADRTDNFGTGWTAAQGGITLRSAWWPSILANLSAFATQVVGGSGGQNSTFWFTGAWKSVSLEGPTVRLRLFPICDTPNFGSGIAIGTPLEYSTSTVDNLACLQRGGNSNGTQALAGIAVQSWTNNPLSFGLLTAVAVAGTHIPVITDATAAVGTTVKVGSATGSTAGKGVVASGPSDGQTLGIVQTAGTSTMAYIRMTAPGGY